MSDRSPILPELMSPAGDWDCAKAAVENGADAIYFGLQSGLNARARAVNFAPAELPELMTFLRTRGVKGYLTLNTLVFSDELPEAEQTVRLAIAAGVDAVLVQDLGLLRLIRQICPDLPLHASTQMTLSSAECIGQLEPLGVRRVVLPRELSIAQIAAIRRQTNVELEVFVHGALCISYSGQCLASLSFGGRSANRGQCAQPCRLPYELICDSQPLRDERPGATGCSSARAVAPYPLSPHDLAAYDRLPQLIAAGVSALKIEGRLKPADYVAAVTRHYRTAIDAVCNAIDRTPCGAGVPPASNLNVQAGRPHHNPLAPDEIAELEAAFSRGLCHGWLDGADPSALVSGQSSAKRGTYLGEVRGVRGQRILVELAAPIRRGDGLVFEGDRTQNAEQGGRVYEIFQAGRSVDGTVSAGLVELAFRYNAIDRWCIHPAQKVWKTDDPQLSRRLRQKRAGLARRVPLDITIEAAEGAPLCLTATATTGAACHVQSPQPLAEAIKHPLSAAVLAEQFGRLGGTPYQLRNLDARIVGWPMIPLSVLGKLRREMLRLLDAAASQPPLRKVFDGSALAACLQNLPSPGTDRRLVGRGAGGEGLPVEGSSVHHHVLCRSMDQLRAALSCGASSLIVELADPDLAADAVRAAHAASAEIRLAAPRIHRPGEFQILESLAQARPDGLLVRNLAALAFCRQRDMPAVADFYLAAVNELTVQWLHQQGAERVTAGYDLNPRRLLDLAARVPPEWLEVVIHRHTPLFHTAHCLLCWALSHGKDRRDCGRPCQRHDLRLRDRLGVEHPLLVDAQCDNTLFHAEPESLAALVSDLRSRGVRHFRIELLAERTLAEVRRTLGRDWLT